jgi:hypothetical protein
MMDDYRDFPVVDGLRELGQRPIDPALEAHHLTLMAQVGQLSGRRRVPRLRVAALVVIGVLFTSTGLAAADINAGPVSDLGQKIAGVVGVDITGGKVNHGTDRYYGPDCLPIAAGKGAINRGQYLKWVRENRPDMLNAAKASNCGKPVSAGTRQGGGDNDPGDG